MTRAMFRTLATTIAVVLAILPFTASARILEDAGRLHAPVPFEVHLVERELEPPVQLGLARGLDQGSGGDDRAAASAACGMAACGAGAAACGAVAIPAIGGPAVLALILVYALFVRR